MRNKVNPWAMAALICAITPNLIMTAYVVRYIRFHIINLGPVLGGVFVVIYALFFGFVNSPIFWTMLLGTSSVVLAIIAIRKRGAKGKPLAVAALILSTLEITSASLRLMLLMLPYV